MSTRLIANRLEDLGITEAEWRVECGEVCGDDGLVLLKADRNDYRTRPVERDNNIKLASAAPDLFEAVVALLAYGDSEHKANKDQAVNMAFAALKKAQGVL